ncbi:DUF4157 domain-containing protein [Dyella silvatica]|uniref:eCIS core domain-containing protein n=1 Tax=Dyella silvatica TaxID=2992128 RepID=UPI00225AAAF6|nr:DUF4157 domain-containing protein [Dyella silvatica]
MQTHTLKPKAAPPPAAAKKAPAQMHAEVAQEPGANARSSPQRAIGNHALKRRQKTDLDRFDDSFDTLAAARPGFDFSQIPVRSRAAEGVLYRHAAASGPAIAPAIVHEVLRDQGRPLPADDRREMEARLGYDFADVRIHTDRRAGTSAEAVAAHAYTVGRHIVFAPGHFDPASAPGRRLLAHELTHAASSAPGMPIPSGQLRISSPTDVAERHAVAVSEGRVAAVTPAAAPAGLFRQPAGGSPLAGVTVNQSKVTVPTIAGLSFSASKIPADAPSVTFSIVGDRARIVAGTTIDPDSGVITVAPAQTGGSAHVEARQNAPGLVTASPPTAPFNFVAIPSGITSTMSSTRGVGGFYGGNFTHTFSSPAGGQAALEGARVNERFPAASGTTLTLTGGLGTVVVTVNDPDSVTAGWPLGSSGMMGDSDHVSWSINAIDAGPFVANASHPSPSPGLPQALTATQNFHNLTFPSQSFSTAAVASTTHRRAIEDRGNRLQAVTSANAAGISQEVVEDYAGPSVFRRCAASPTSIPVTPPSPSPPPRGRGARARAPRPATSTITVDVEGRSARPTFSINSPDLGCTITPRGVLTAGTTAGTVTVRAGNTTNFDEVSVTVAAPAAAAPPASPTNPSNPSNPSNPPNPPNPPP